MLKVNNKEVKFEQVNASWVIGNFEYIILVKFSQKRTWKVTNNLKATLMILNFLNYKNWYLPLKQKTICQTHKVNKVALLGYITVGFQVRWRDSFPTNIYLFKVNNRNIAERCDIRVLFLLTLNIFQTLF